MDSGSSHPGVSVDGWKSEADHELTSRLAVIVESSSDAIIGKTLDGVITSWNSGAEHLYGYTSQEIVGHNVSELFPPNSVQELVSILDRIRRGERIEQFETKRLGKDGSILDVSITISPIRDASSAVIGASTVARDLTERNRAEADRRAFEARLQQGERLESLGQLAGGIAHDFNNLLAVILNYAAFVAEETSDRPEVRADVEQIEAAAERAVTLTKQLLIFGRREVIQPEALELNAVVADIENLLSRSIGEHIELRCNASANLPRILADRGQVEQVLLNLAVNARDAMPDGGTLTIETSVAELDEGYSRIHPHVNPGQYLELEVSDTGSGMSAEVSAHIFEPYFTTKPPSQGTGLGLSSVYGIMTEGGGSLSVYSEEGMGTTFRLYFPITEQPLTPAALGSENYEKGHGETIIVVDDEPSILEIASRILRQNGYSALAAATYDEALSLAETQDFQLLLTDSVMPGMSGRALAQRMDEVRPGRAVLFMSGYSAGALSPHRIVDEGVTFIQKPFNRRTLLEKVHDALRESPAAGGEGA